MLLMRQIHVVVFVVSRNAIQHRQTHLPVVNCTQASFQVRKLRQQTFQWCHTRRVGTQLCHSI